MLVRISAHLIHWPTICACCLRPANSHFYAAYTRVTGKKVIRHDSRGWNVPYCSTCEDHVAAWQQAQRFTSAGAYATLVVGILLGVFVIFFGPCCCGAGLFTPAKAPGAKRPPRPLLFASVAISLVAGGSVIAGSVVRYQRLHKKARSRRRMTLEHADSLTSRSCCSTDPAVSYEGWYGTVHTFWFGNHQYANAFIRNNRDKIVS